MPLVMVGLVRKGALKKQNSRNNGEKGISSLFLAMV
jgi:hypothetical protein